MGAALSAYETLVGKARTSAAQARSSAIFRSDDNRRVLTFMAVSGQDAFQHINAAWDDHHLYAEHRDIAEASALMLYKLVASSGESLLDPLSTDAVAFEFIARAPQALRDIIAPITATVPKSIDIHSLT